MTSSTGYDYISVDKDNGFTLVEILAVVIILSIILAVLLTRMPSLSDHTQLIEKDTLRSHIRYAQSRAMNSNNPWGIVFNSESSYSLFEIDGAVTVTRTIPGAEFVSSAHSYNPDNDEKTIDLQVLRISSPASITFDANGSPGPVNVLLIDGNGDTVFTIVGDTGYLR